MERFVAQHSLPHVFFLGFKNQQDLPACYAMSDLLVLPSSVEPWGLVVNEAMCFGLPVIASDRVGAAADLVNPGVNGFTFRVGDIESLAGLLRSLLVDGETRKKMGSQSYSLISRWGIPEDIEGVLESLKRVCACRAR